MKDLLNFKEAAGAFLLILALFMVVYFLLAGTAYVLVFKFKKKELRKYRINPRFTPSKLINQEVHNSLVTILIFAIAGFVTWLLFRLGLTQLYLYVSSWPYLVMSYFLLILLHDAYFYWTHRLLHLKPFLRFHKTHHLSANPSPFAAFSFHPFEAMVQALYLPLAALIVPAHPAVLAAVVFYNILVNVIGHAGYEFFPQWFRKSWIGSISNTPVHHASHHFYFINNYGLYLNIWDKWMHTFNPRTEEMYDEVSQRIHKK